MVFHQPNARALADWIRRLLILTSLLSCGCALSVKPAPAPVQRRLVVNFVAHDVHCARAFWNAQTYLQSVGVLLLHNPVKYSYTLICIPPRPLLLSMLPAVEGQAYKEVGYFQAARSDAQTTKTLLHEIGHVLGCAHTASGIMAPFSDTLPFATGYSEESLRQMGLKPAHSSAPFQSRTPPEAVPNVRARLEQPHTPG